MFPKRLRKKLEDRKAHHAFRELGKENNYIDFSSNDYLGFSKSETIFNNTHNYLLGHNIIQNGATGSRLLSGNHPLYNLVETVLCEFHNSESATIFNSGYDANLGFFSSVPQRGDIIYYDEFIHASIRDGISLSHAKSYKFKHNDLNNLADILNNAQDSNAIYVVTESVFSMDGDAPDLVALSRICKTYKAYLIIDEAHAIGIFGVKGQGLVQASGLEHDVFARLVTFGKALGIHGAAILGSEMLKRYLVNFSRSFIYTTALPPHTLAGINAAYQALIQTHDLEILHSNIQFFKSEIQRLHLEHYFISSHSAIHCIVIPGNERVKLIANKMNANGFDVKAILSPTVLENHERLRFCLHSYNSKAEITKVLELLATFVSI